MSDREPLGEPGDNHSSIVAKQSLVLGDGNQSD